MTNGEKFQQIFAVSQVDECDLNVYAWLPIHDAIEIPLEWWNANYSEIPIVSTTKNDLGVDCISRADAIQAMQDKAKKLTNEDTINGLCGAVAILFDLPSVTPQEPFINKPCVSSEICEHDKNKVLDKIRAEIKQYQSDYDVHGTEYDRTAWKAFNRCLQIIDKYKAETEEV